MAARMPPTIATIIAAVQVFEIKALIITQTAATAARIRPGRSPDPRHREHAIRQPPIDAMQPDCLGDQK